MDGDFSRISQTFRTPVYFTPPLTEFPLELSIGAHMQGRKTMMMRMLLLLLSGGLKTFELDLAVYTQYRRVTESVARVKIRNKKYHKTEIDNWTSLITVTCA